MRKIHPSLLFLVVYNTKENNLGWCFSKGIADKMKSVRLVQIFCPVKETNRTHSKGYVEDLPSREGEKDTPRWQC